MHTIDLSSNDITDQGAKLLAEALNTLNAPCLERLDLSRNKIGSKGLSYLAVRLTFVVCVCVCVRAGVCVCVCV